MEITPFLFFEISHMVTLTDHWPKGGYPKSILQPNLQESIDWRLDYIRTFLERDIPNLGIKIPALILERFWKMFAHTHCQLVNFSNLAKALGISHHTIKSYLDILEQTFIIKTLP